MRVGLQVVFPLLAWAPDNEVGFVILGRRGEVPC